MKQWNVNWEIRQVRDGCAIYYDFTCVFIQGCSFFAVLPTLKALLQRYQNQNSLYVIAGDHRVRPERVNSLLLFEL